MFALLHLFQLLRLFVSETCVNALVKDMSHASRQLTGCVEAVHTPAMHPDQDEQLMTSAGRQQHGNRFTLKPPPCNTLHSAPYATLPRCNRPGIRSCKHQLATHCNCSSPTKLLELNLVNELVADLETSINSYFSLVMPLCIGCRVGGSDAPTNTAAAASTVHAAPWACE